MTVSEIIEKTGQSEAAILREHLLLTALSNGHATRRSAPCLKKNTGTPWTVSRRGLMHNVKKKILPKKTISLTGNSLTLL